MKQEEFVYLKNCIDMVKRILYLVFCIPVGAITILGAPIFLLAMIVRAAVVFVKSGETDMLDPKYVMWLPVLLDKLFWGNK